MQTFRDFWNRGLSGKLVIIGSALLICCVCGAVFVSFLPASSNRTTESPAAVPTQRPSNTAGPTSTPAPTDTPRPTDTPEPTLTPTPPPEPIFLNGIGDSILDFTKWDGFAILHVKHLGARNFVVKNYAVGSSDPIDLLINTIGPYEGTVPIDLFNDERTARLEIKADGQWEVQILPLQSVRLETIPGVFQGVGDEVFIVKGGNPDLLKVDASQASHNFIVRVVTDSGWDGIVNEIAPYTGTTILDPSTVMFIIKATGPWTLEVTTR
jgi:hypothetical protein